MMAKLLDKKCLVFVLLGLFTLTGCQEKIVEKMKLYKDSYSIEYGESVSLNIPDYLDNSEEFLKNVKIENIPENESEKSYPAVGNYEIILKNENEEKKVNIIIKDTVAPVFKNLKTKYEVDFGVKLDIKDIKADDLSKVTVVCDDSKVNYKKAGNYEVKFTATDVSGNKVVQNVSVIVRDKKKEEKTVKQETSQKESSKPVHSSSSTENSQPESQNSESEQPTQNLIETLNVSKNYSKVFIVSSKSYTARQGIFTYYHKIDGNWKKEFETDAILGKAGIGTARENLSKTPIGQYTFTKLFGIADDPGTLMGYHKLDGNDYWCGETYYNQFIDEDNHEHVCSKENDEHLIQYTMPYQYAAAFNYNPQNIVGKGAAFFLHCSSGNHYTGGCVAISPSYMKTVMQQIDGDTVMIIDLDKNISHY